MRQFQHMQAGGNSPYPVINIDTTILKSISQIAIIPVYQIVYLESSYWRIFSSVFHEFHFKNLILQISIGKYLKYPPYIFLATAQEMK